MRRWGRHIAGMATGILALASLLLALGGLGHSHVDALIFSALSGLFALATWALVRRSRVPIN